jgi:dolichyl-phosphate-mannose--protein O-mannosyl transferase
VERAGRVLRSPVFVIILVTLLAGWLRFANLSFPRELVFDETYYAKDACIYLSEPAKDCGLEMPNEQSWVHPPLGKWMIAGGEALFGATVEGPQKSPFGWRFSSAAAGTLTVALTAILALLLTESVLWAGVSGLLLATESLSFVQSRMSMLDIFEALFVVAGFLFLVLDRRWIGRRDPHPEPAQPMEEEGAETGLESFSSSASFGPGAMAADELLMTFPEEPPPRVHSPLLRPWRVAAGLAFGAGMAVKWSAATALVGAVLLSYGWEVSRRKRVGRPHPYSEALLQEAFGILISLAIAPLVVYVATWSQWLGERHWNFAELIKHHWQMLDFHIHLEAFKPDGKPTHPYQSRAWTWLLQTRPVSYYYKGGEGTAAEILGMGNPAIFWGSLIAIPYAVLRWIKARDWQAGVVAVAFLSQYLPWLPVNRPIFLFYMTPMAPFMVLAAVLALKRLSQARLATGAQPFAAVAGLLVGISVSLFVFFHPILVGDTVSSTGWQARIWFQSWV